ncbi:peptidylprolyl isomerase [Bacterioplanes sanyensis]|uniref:Peptidyl-prolyl cis-trans isomerase n=1 Tax=Bacterioplanes sanyensis TaxID=1249553 RepID=A0A222FI93_9GAMM|nr:peptidylprolyl isomerase [Bacterioplanes sanyensis]ASP38372.1 peptidylprolyl isomerase [Bacterioplanes sanyensis]
MQIAPNTVVQLHYDLTDDQGEKIESTRSGEPLLYLQGHGNMLAAFEAQMEGHEAGQRFRIELSAEQAYGPATEAIMQRVPVKHLQGAKRWRPGMVGVIHTDQGVRQVTVKKVGRFMVDVDISHPLAGRNLCFDVEVLAVRAATQDEIAHRHAHGIGGHQH